MTGKGIGMLSHKGSGGALAVGALLLINASASSLRATLINDGLPLFLALLVLLLALMLLAVIRLPPDLARPAEAGGPDETDFADPGPPAWYPQAAAPSPGLAQLSRPGYDTVPPQVARQSSLRGYAARHSPGQTPVQEQDTLGLPRVSGAPPKVSGGPPWGPAPRPPGLR